MFSARRTPIRPVNMTSLSRLAAQDEDLVPGLSNEIVLGEIVLRLPWRAFHTLSFVSRSWRQAIRSHQVFDARVRVQSTETLLLLNFSYYICSLGITYHALCLYSVTEKTFHSFPDFPYKRYSHRGIPSSCGCVTLDGKIYVLGGESEDNCNIDSRKVYVLDLAGQTGWRQCANMLESRKNFATGVIDGKIYVAGGTSCGKTIRSSEVYDPKENAWSSIRPMISTRANHKFVTVGEELCLYGGWFSDRDCGGPTSPEVYHPSTGEWELVKPIKSWSEEILFPTQGKIYCFDGTIVFGYNDNEVYSVPFDGTYVLGCTDLEEWTELHSFSFPGVESPASTEAFAAYPVNDDLFALLLAKYETAEGDDYEMTLLQGKGFGRENCQLVWEKLAGDSTVWEKPFSDEHDPAYGELANFMCPVQL